MTTDQQIGSLIIPATGVMSSDAINAVDTANRLLRKLLCSKPKIFASGVSRSAILDGSFRGG